MKKSKEIISCVCMTCGVRNNHSHESGLCQNGHDAWLEYRDVISKNEWFYSVAKKFNMTESELTEKFMDSSVLQL